MLKPTDPAGLPPTPDEDRPIGELVHELIENGKVAVRVPVQLGRTSVTTVEVLQGVAAGDRVIVSDMSRWDGVERVRLR